MNESKVKSQETSASSVESSGVNSQQSTANSQQATTNSQQPAKRRWRVTRRGFLIGVGATGAALALGVTFGMPVARVKLFDMLNEGDASSFGSTTNDPWAWFEVTPDNQVKLFMSKIEMGQGVHTSLKQIAVEELGIPFDELMLTPATTHLGPADQGTTGSSSVSSLYIPLRQAAATLREVLRTKASTVLGQPADSLKLEGRSFVVTGQPEKKITFGELVTAPGEWVVPKEPPALKEVQDFTVIGKPIPRIDIPAKVTGQAVYGYDVKLPGMKFGAILRSPTIEGKLKSVNAEKAKAMPGVHSVVVESGFAGIVADSRTIARAAVAQLEANWEEGKRWQQAELDAFVTVSESGGITIQKVNGAGSGGVSDADTNTITGEYRSPFAVQTPLEAQAALADVQPDNVRVWVSTQMASSVQGEVAKALAIKAENIEVIPTYVGGGFGRKSGFEVAVEAARLSKAAGVPVHVGWNRTEELRYGYFRPPTHSKLSAQVTHEGQIVSMEHQQASGDVAAQFLPGFLTTLFGADFGAARGARILYAIPNILTVAHRRQMTIRTGWWRGLGLLANTFAVESFVDEIAHALQVDPLQLRLSHLGDEPRQQRMKRVLEAAAEKAGWGTPAPAGRARGIACCVDVDTVVAEVAEVSFDEASGKIRVHQVTAAMDCGLTINPDGAKAQIEGNVIWGLGSTLIEEMQVKDGQFVPANFDGYPLLTLKEAPQIESVLLEAGDGKPRGVGEPAIGPVAAAVGNAFFALTGTRLRQIPFTPERIKAAMK